MSLRDNLRTKEDIFASDYITIAELAIFFEGSKEKLYEEMRSEMKKTPIQSRFDLMDLE